MAKRLVGRDREMCHTAKRRPRVDGLGQYESRDCQCESRECFPNSVDSIQQGRGLVREVLEEARERFHGFAFFYFFLQIG